MKQILSRVPIFLGSVFLMILATAAPLLALAVIVSGTAFYVIAASRSRDALEPEPVRSRVTRR